jgi:hypothetical protein
MIAIILNKSDNLYITKTLTSFASKAPSAKRIWIAMNSSETTIAALQTLGDTVWVYNESEQSFLHVITYFKKQLTDLKDSLLFVNDFNYPSAGILRMSMVKTDIALLKTERDYRDVIERYSEYYNDINNGFHTDAIFIKAPALKKLINVPIVEQANLLEYDYYTSVCCQRLKLSCSLYTYCKTYGKIDEPELTDECLQHRKNLKNKKLRIAY